MKINNPINRAFKTRERGSREGKRKEDDEDGVNNGPIKSWHLRSPDNRHGAQDVWGVLGGGGGTCREGGAEFIHVRLAG